MDLSLLNLNMWENTKPECACRQSDAEQMLKPLFALHVTHLPTKLLIVLYYFVFDDGQKSFYKEEENAVT